MKKTILFAVAALISTITFAQAPLGMNYQAVVRNSAGTPVANGMVRVKFSIHDVSASGVVIYTETASVPTNQFGLMSTVIGSNGNMAGISWRSGGKFLQVEVDPAGGTNFIDMGTTQLMSVPYALYAEYSGNSSSGGATGATGPQGATGAQGATGPAGAAGANGTNGTNGVNGAAGATGAKGDTGPKGDTGAQGPQGATGPAGINGTNGAAGAAGPTGPKGATGADGALNAWGVNGTSGTNSANFLGTIDNQPLSFRMNNQPSGKIETGNTFFGYKTGVANTGIQNLAVGAEALSLNTNGFSNTAIGYHAMLSNTTGNYNSVVGNSSLVVNTTGSGNTTNGAGTLYYNTTGSYNTAIGYDALLTNTTGLGNTATGTGSLFNNTTGNYNVAHGYEALKTNTVGAYNTAIGTAALTNNVGGGYNTAQGYNAMLANTTGGNNVATGYRALLGNTTGGGNTALGYSSLSSNTTGDFNTAIGYNAGPTTNGFSNTTAIGYGAATSAHNQIRIGNSSVTSIGGFQDWTNVSDGRFKKDITESVPGLAFITKLRPVTYHLDMQSIASYLHTSDNARSAEAESLKGNMLQTGFIAQEVEKSAKELGFDFSGVDVPKNDGDFYGLRYAEFTVPLVKAVQELNAKNEQQQQVISELLKRIEALEKNK